MSIKKFSMLMLSAMSLAALLNGCGSSSKEGSTNLGGVPRVADEAVCRTCHADTIDPVSGTPIVADFIGTPATGNVASVHFLDTRVGCEGCHGGGAQHNGVGPIPFPNPLTENRCITCHTATGLAPPQFPAGGDLTPLFETAKGGFVTNGCANCHTASRIGSVHGSLVPTTEDCVLCHAVASPNHGTNLVNDNNGVRAITVEFAKWSHHVTGVTLNSAHCAACHLEGTIINAAGINDGLIHVDTTKHMVDNKTHLRNADTDADLQWDPAAANHTTMDNFCMSCHDANGATSPVSAQIQGFINRNGLAASGKTASASNPFGDTISNRYDKMQRPAVVDASSQFNTTNNSHHAVKGPRYTGRTRAAGPRQIASPATFANNSSALLQGVRSTIFDAGNLNQLYTPLENAGGEVAPRTGAATLGDDSTLHCGDCHTVGQWKVASSTTANGSDTPAAIGAHGSNNEYLLRNSIGTDQRHTQNAFLNVAGTVVYQNPNGAFLVCYNCHNYNKYGSIFLATGVVGGHVGEYDAAGRCNGIGNTLPFNGYTTGTATDGTQFVSRFNGPLSRYTTPAPYAGEQDPDFGNIFGIQCANCHNSGTGNAYGGIHGSAKNQQTTPAKVLTPVGTAFPAGGYYIDGMGNATKIERFLPGLGNAMHVPGTLGGFTGGVFANFSANGTAADYQYITRGVSNDTNWEQRHWQQTATQVVNLTTGAVSGSSVSAGAGCYTLGANADAATSALRGPSVTGAGGPATELFDTWGGCDDHNARQGGGDHGFIKKIVRPVTY